MKSPKYIGKVIECRMLMVHVRFSLLLKILILLVLACSLPEYEIRAQVIFSGETKEPPFIYDETPVRIMVAGYKDFYLNVLYTNNKLLFVNIEDLFKTLNIPCVSGHQGDSLGGFIENENRTYEIDYNTKQIQVGDKTFDSPKGLVKEMGTLYLESSLFAEAFGINLSFNYRSQSIQLKANFELPVIKQQRIEKMRSNMSKLKGEDFPDTIVQRNYHLFKPGMLDWSVFSIQTLNGSTDYQFNLGIGTELLFGEADISLDYYNQQKFDNRSLRYLWRWIDNDKRIIKQAQAGMISYHTISFINSPIVGASVRNSSSLVRKATGYYTINEFTEPNWIVELYINNVLVGFTRADASGSYTFKVPIVYGFSTLKLKFYGPMGEERVEERTMNVPYNVMPAREFEYSLSAGILQNSNSSRFGQAEMSYGVNRFLTVRGGVEYLSSIPNGPFIPFATATIQPFSKLIIIGEYAYGVRYRGLLDYYFWKEALLEIDYANYVDGQLATIFNAHEERKARLSVPFRIKKFTGYAKIDYSQLVYSSFSYNQANIMLSGYYKQFSANSSTQLNWTNQKIPYITSDLALSSRLKKGIIIRASVRYNISENTFMTCTAVIEKGIPKGYLTATYERNVLTTSNYFSLGFRYDLPFARTSISASHSNGSFNIYESAEGSLAFGGGNNNIQASSNPSVGRGGIMFYPFLDLNNNGIFDDGERMVKLNSLKIFGGRAVFSRKDLIVRVPNLNAFANYLVEFRDNDLENISWRFKDKIYQVLIDPNQFKRVDVPIIIVGEVSGMAYMDKGDLLKGTGRILVKFYKKNSDKVVAETLSESDGYIDYMGLAPGDYVARIDSVQLSKLGLKADPPERGFTIRTMEQGDMVQGIDFVLRPEAKKP